MGPSGSGHFVKMVHNGVEYGLMEAYAEGFNLMHHKEEFGLNIRQSPKYGAMAASSARGYSTSPRVPSPTTPT